MISIRMLLSATLGVALFATTATPQIPRSKIYSNPAALSSDALRRLNLTMAWSAAVPMDGRRDGMLMIAMDRRDMIVLTRSGQVSLLDAETGIQKWRTRAGKSYTLMPFYAANSRSVYVIANANAYALDRATGAKKWELPLRAGISAAPIVDEEQIYVPYANGRFASFYLPFVGVGDDLKSGKGESGSSPIYGSLSRIAESRPKPVWEEETNIQLSFKPLQTSDFVFLISPAGEAIAYTKVAREAGGAAVVYRFSTDGKIRQQLGQYADTAYIGSEDAAVYAVNMLTGKLRWRHVAGTAISRRPIALEKDLYVTSSGEGLARIDRDTGNAMWRIPRGREFVPANVDADHFLAANHKFVYAADNSGRLLILDRKRGTRLSMLDTTAYRFPVVNDLTDRLYLAANNGLIVCLHDRDQMRAIRHRSALEQASSPVVKQLEQKVTDPGGKPMTLRDALANLRVKYKLRFVVAERAFKEAGNAGVQDKMVNLPRIENQTLKKVLVDLLTQANATYQIVDDTILVVPGKAK